MGCASSVPGPVKPRTVGFTYTPEELVQYDPKNGPFFRLRPEELRPIQYAPKGDYSKEAFPGSTVIKAFVQAKSVHGDSPALRIERPCPPLNPDGTAPPSAPQNEWKTWTWAQYYDECRRVAKSLVACGVERYEGVTVYGFNAPEWHMSQLGITMAGCLTAGIYPTDAPEAVAFKTKHCRAKVAIIEDDAKLVRYEEIVEQVPRLTYIVGYSPEFTIKKTIERQDKSIVQVVPWAEFLTLGDGVDDARLDEIEKTITPADCAGLIYTSGTTGNPKAVAVSHDNLLVECFSLFNLVPAIGEAGQERIISYLPLSHVAACMVDIIAPVYLTANRPGYETVYFARPYDLKASTIGDRLRAVRPTIFLGVPRVWEKIMEKMQAKARETKGLKKQIVAWAKAKGLQAQLNQELGGSGELPSNYERADKMVLSKVRAVLGLNEAKLLATAAAPIDRSTLAYFGSLGMCINEVYGMSECAGAATMGTNEAHLWGSVGSAFGGLEVKVLRKEGDKYVECPRAKDLFNPTEEEQGELCYRGRSIMIGYMSCPEVGDYDDVLKKNQETIDAEGWLHSGDKGCCDERAMFRITGRFKELIIGAGGENIAPVPIEDSIKRIGKGVISNAHMVGDKRKYNVVLITLVAKGATGEKPGGDDLDGLALDVVPGVTKISEAVKNAEFIKRIEQIIKDTNADGTACPSNASKVTKFTILPSDYSVETEELTATLKLKRGYTEKKFAKAIDAMFDESVANQMYVPFVA